MRESRYNKLQQVASAISGYDHFDDFSSARNDYYYELDNDDARLNQILIYSCEVYGNSLSRHEAKVVVDFLRMELDMTQDQIWHAFEELK